MREKDAESFEQGQKAEFDDGRGMADGDSTAEHVSPPPPHSHAARGKTWVWGLGGEEEAAKTTAVKSADIRLGAKHIGACVDECESESSSLRCSALGFTATAATSHHSPCLHLPCVQGT